ncbi:uncharacterized protein PGTG_14018 [Puccinia graminis f. sp. tritici CRL 75-36-700-3]|uniref:CxC1-like cysteine cluster associated with KDZ transposases domain-containing protein n=1 Tax=Puccinia graminis f. sp. tritici (strain CRL 75-36-700-3 / race SCCL) TaxID=418459 RepID=E3KVW5_PUCGT|nr:uncharacterized protein PGTG_14018 [Puccinia graminis f. sp. tritici CRL 75-36-700-3]EFP88440.1 hypothetical protein PGTG_14018 [Puccinia graminis f. sp. tritici CRL 75-36-700-3]
MSSKSNNGKTYMDQCSPCFTIVQQTRPTGVMSKYGTVIGNQHVAVLRPVKDLQYSWISSAVPSKAHPDGVHWCNPQSPKTAFSIQLLQLHHILWKHCTIAMLPSSKAIDEFPDINNPLILVPHGEDDLEESRKQLGQAVDAFQEMLKRENKLLAQVMRLEPLGELADICPKWYGQQVDGKREGQPD